MYTLECNKLCKRYDKVRNVIDNLDLQIPEGKIVGLLGPNGFDMRSACFRGYQFADILPA